MIELTRTLKEDYHIEKLFFIDDNHFNVTVVNVLLDQTNFNFESILKQEENSLIEIINRDLKKSWVSNISFKIKELKKTSN